MDFDIDELILQAGSGLTALFSVIAVLTIFGSILKTRRFCFSVPFRVSFAAALCSSCIGAGSCFLSVSRYGINPVTSSTTRVPSGRISTGL